MEVKMRLNIILLIVHIIVTAIFVVLGIVFSRGKGAFLIAGYNTSSSEEKEKYDKSVLCKFVGKIMFAMAACLLVIAISDLIDSTIPLWIGLSLFFGVAIFAIVFANTNNRFRK